MKSHQTEAWCAVQLHVGGVRLLSDQCFPQPINGILMTKYTSISERGITGQTGRKLSLLEKIVFCRLCVEVPDGDWFHLHD